jgi:hypothetical protein
MPRPKKENVPSRIFREARTRKPQLFRSLGVGVMQRANDPVPTPTCSAPASAVLKNAAVGTPPLALDAGAAVLVQPTAEKSPQYREKLPNPTPGVGATENAWSETLALGAGTAVLVQPPAAKSPDRLSGETRGKPFWLTEFERTGKMPTAEMVMEHRRHTCVNAERHKMERELAAKNCPQF